METTTVTIPNWTIDLYHLFTRNWRVGLFVLVVVALATGLTEYLKRRKKNKLLVITPEDKVKLRRYITLMLTGLTTFFTTLGYFLVLAEPNAKFLTSLPLVGEYAATALSTAYVLYNLRLNKWYQLLANKFGKSVATPTPAAPDFSV